MKPKAVAPYISTSSRAYAALKREAEHNRIIGNLKEAKRCDARAEMIWRRFLAWERVG